MHNKKVQGNHRKCQLPSVFDHKAKCFEGILSLMPCKLHVFNPLPLASSAKFKRLIKYHILHTEYLMPHILSRPFRLCNVFTMIHMCDIVIIGQCKCNVTSVTPRIIRQEHHISYVIHLFHRCLHDMSLSSLPSSPLVMKISNI